LASEGDFGRRDIGAAAKKSLNGTRQRKDIQPGPDALAVTIKGEPPLPLMRFKPYTAPVVTVAFESSNPGVKA
jgi:hypothetical protein